jgi:uncharacterized protein (DUF1778 family)
MPTETRRVATPRGRRITKNRRIAFRLTEELGTRLERAVAISGRSQTELITEAIADKTNAIIREQRLLELSDRDMDALLGAIAAPPVANEAMRRSVARWRERNAVQ